MFDLVHDLRTQVWKLAGVARHDIQQEENEKQL